MENAVGEENQMEMAYLGLSYWQFANCNAAAIFGIWQPTVTWLWPQLWEHNWMGNIIWKTLVESCRNSFKMHFEDGFTRSSSMEMNRWKRETLAGSRDRERIFQSCDNWKISSFAKPQKPEENAIASLVKLMLPTLCRSSQRFKSPKSYKCRKRKILFPETEKRANRKHILVLILWSWCTF